jgi:hypothetical protein
LALVLTVIISIILAGMGRYVTHRSRFCGPSAFGKKYAAQVCCISKNAGFFHGLGPLGTSRHRTRPFQSRQRFGFQIELGPPVFLFLSHGRQKLDRPIAICLFGARHWNREPGR